MELDSGIRLFFNLGTFWTPDGSYNPHFGEPLLYIHGEEKQPRLAYSSHTSMENQLIAVIVRFPSALPTTKSRDPGGHLSVYQHLLYHQEAAFLTSTLENFSAPHSRFNSPVRSSRACSVFFFKHLLTRNGTGGHSSIDFSI